MEATKVHADRTVNRRARALVVIAVVALVGVTLALAAGLTQFLTGADHVDVTVVNDTAFEVHVEGLGTARRGTTTFLEVADGGDDWVVSLDYGGVDAGTMRIEDGRGEIPASAEAALVKAGRVPQP